MRGESGYGEAHGFAPPTPPDMRVRIRRFGGLAPGRQSISESRASRGNHWAAQY